jgi:hypothetical protein
MGISSGGEPGAILAEVSTTDATPTALYLAESALQAFEAVVWAEETGLSRALFRHFKLSGSLYVTSEATWLIANAAIASEGAAGAATWAAAFALTTPQQTEMLTLQVTGAFGVNIDWHAKITIHPTP